MKICHICSYFENILFSDLVKQMEKKRLEGRVYYFKARGKEGINSHHDFVDLRYCFNDYEKFFFRIKHKHVLKDFNKYLEKYDFDLLYAHSLFSNGYLAYKENQKRGTPYIVYVQNTDINIFFKYRKSLAKLGVRILKNAEKIIFSNPCYKKEVLEKYVKSYEDRIVIETKCFIIPYGIDNVFFNDECIHTKNQTPKSINVLTVGLICKNKNQIAIKDALNILSKQGIIVKYTIIGKNGDEKVYNELANCEFVELIEYMDKQELIEYYRKSDIFCLSSKTETFGLVYAEAISQGLPIIYSEGQGFDGLFPEGYIGYHVDPINPTDIANKIIMVKELIDGDIYKRCIKASKKFSWDAIMNDYLKILDDL